jgi:hypothetical protein
MHGPLVLQLVIPSLGLFSGKEWILPVKRQSNRLSLLVRYFPAKNTFLDLKVLIYASFAPGITFDAATNLFQGTYSGSAPSTHETNLTFTSLSLGSGLILQVHFTFFPAGVRPLLSHSLSGSIMVNHT